LLELAIPTPEGALFQVWWLALVAASCGVLETIEESTVLYRQHSRNQVGALPQKKKNTLWDARHILQQPKTLKLRMGKAMLIVQSHANALLCIAGHRMPRRKREFLRVFCLPRRRDEITALPWIRQAWLFTKFVVVSARALPLALRWCY